MQNNSCDKEILKVAVSNGKYLCMLFSSILVYDLINKLIINNYNARIDIKNSKIEIYK